MAQNSNVVNLSQEELAISEALDKINEAISDSRVVEELQRIGELLTNFSEITVENVQVAEAGWWDSFWGTVATNILPEGYSLRVGLSVEGAIPTVIGGLGGELTYGNIYSEDGASHTYAIAAGLGTWGTGKPIDVDLEIGLIKGQPEDYAGFFSTIEAEYALLPGGVITGSGWTTSSSDDYIPFQDHIEYLWSLATNNTNRALEILNQNGNEVFVTLSHTYTGGPSVTAEFGYTWLTNDNVAGFPTEQLSNAAINQISIAEQPNDKMVLATTDTDILTVTTNNGIELYLGGNGQIEIAYGGDGNDILKNYDQGVFIDTNSAYSIIIDGRGGNDHIYGGNNSDNLIGGKGDDVIRGEGGNDVLVGGEGADQLFGGSSYIFSDNDVASYAGSSAGVDVDLRRTGSQFAVTVTVY